jgi:hypothetical protein
MTARWVAIASLLVACKGKESVLSGPPAKAPADAPGGFVHPPIDARAVDVPAADWAACQQVLETAPKLPAMRRVQTIIAACRPCGDWKPLLEWSTEQVNGGPTRTQIEDAMIACKGYCSPDAKQRFLGTLDKFRGKDTRGPWRFLGDLCKDKVSAVPDNRYASAPHFALDRIARAVGERPDLAPLLDAFDFPLPVISISGYGFELAKSPVTAPDAGPLAITVAPQDIRFAVVPRGKLTKDGVTTLIQGEAYPGTVIKTSSDLDKAIGKLGRPIEFDSAIAVFAPSGMTAHRLLDVLAITGERPRRVLPGWLTGDVRLAVAADGGLPGWPLAGSIPVALRTTPMPGALILELDDNPDPVIEKLKGEKAKLAAALAKAKPVEVDDHGPPWQLYKPVLAIRLGPKATVAGLAKLIGAAVYFDVKSVALLKGAAHEKAGPP